LKLRFLPGKLQRCSATTSMGGFKSQLAANPALGSVVNGGGGIRKVRLAVGSRGKSGGARVIYYWAARRDLILLLRVPQECYSEYDSKTDHPASKACEEQFGNEIQDV